MTSSSESTSGHSTFEREPARRDLPAPGDARAVPAGGAAAAPPVLSEWQAELLASGLVCARW
jgi:hypothetical protein